MKINEENLLFLLLNFEFITCYIIALLLHAKPYDYSIPCKKESIPVFNLLLYDNHGPLSSKIQTSNCDTISFFRAKENQTK